MRWGVTGVIAGHQCMGGRCLKGNVWWGCHSSGHINDGDGGGRRGG